MKIVATDSAHAALPYQLLMHNLSKKIRLPFLDFGTISIKYRIAEHLDGLECFIPASLTINERDSKKRIHRLRKSIERVRKRVNPNFDYYAFHGLYEHQSPDLADYNLNLADNNTQLKAKNIEEQLLKQIKVARALSDQKKPILNLHPGWVPDKTDCLRSMRTVESIVESCLEKDDNVIICLENMPPADQGYNLLQNPEDLHTLANSKSIGITYDMSHLECTRYRRSQGKESRKTDDNIKDFREFHSQFLSVYGNNILYMHWNFNDIFFLGEKDRLDPYYKYDRHSPPSRVFNTKFAREAFNPVTIKALRIIQANMGENACFNVEVPRKKVFFRTYCVNGATEKELIGSYRYAGRLAREAKK